MRTFIPWRRNFVKRHEDFEIFEHDGKFCFTIDYIGTFRYKTRDSAEKGVIFGKQYVERLLEEIEKQNQLYYKSINDRMEKQNAALRKEHKRKLSHKH